jgi:hypothetical protein
MRECQIESQPSILSKDYGALDNVLKFSNIARPIISFQQLRIVVGKADIGSIETTAKERYKVMRESGDIIAPIPERGYLQGKDAKPVIEVFPETPLAYLPP